MIYGKSEAVTTFATRLGVSKSSLERSAEQILLDHPLLSIFKRVHLSEDGRVAAKTPKGMSSTESVPKVNEADVHWWMLQEYINHLALNVHGCILPALKAIRSEHGISQADFVSLAQNSPVVPTGREQLVGKALYHGFEEDFGTSLHLLAPQLEHIVRIHLQNAGAVTTLLKDGIETENSINTLVKLPEMERVFGEDLTFEVCALFCDPRGLNLRNRVAHGLVDDHFCQSQSSIYAWWFLLRLIFFLPEEPRGGNQVLRPVAIRSNTDLA